MFFEKHLAKKRQGLQIGKEKEAKCDRAFQCCPPGDLGPHSTLSRFSAARAPAGSECEEGRAPKSAQRVLRKDFGQKTVLQMSRHTKQTCRTSAQHPFTTTSTSTPACCVIAISSSVFIVHCITQEHHKISTTIKWIDRQRTHLLFNTLYTYLASSCPRQ